MSVLTRCSAVSLLLSLLMAAPALAQTSSGETSWSDPPARAPENPAPTKPADGKPQAGTPVTETAPAAAPTPATPAERAATALGVKPVDSAKGGSSVAAIQTQRAIVRPRMVERPMVIARRRVRVVERARERPAQRIARRATRGYASAPTYRADGTRTPSWSRRRLAGWGGLTEENRASRIVGAREAGDTFMPMRTYESPGAPRFPRLLPFDGDDPGDVD